MIDPLDIYLQGDYRDERAEIDRLQALSQHLLRVFSKYYEIAEQTWPYELVDGHEGEARGFSFSTTAMILFALAVALGKVSKSVLVPTVRLIPIPVSQDKHSKEAVDHLLETVPKVISTFIEKSVKQVDQGRVTESATFGDNDPFTLTWMLELLGAYPEQSHHLIGQGNKTYLGRFREIAKERIEGVFGDPEGDRQDRPSNAGAQEPRVVKGLLKRTDERSDREYLSQALSIRNPKVGGTPITHAFPLLRFVQLYRLLVGSYPVHIDPALMRKALKNRIHLHLSLSAIPDTGFDAAEMVFSLEGVMLLNPDSPDLALIDRVFGVLAERQNVNPYWRPLRPLKVSSQGLTLLPQSVEVTNSLLRICGALERDEGRSHFSEHVDLFKRYARWLEARLYKATDGKFIGWESEHTYTGNTVHLWQTSQVLLLLQHYSGMLQRHIARRSLSAARIYPRAFPRDKPSAIRQWANWQRSEPVRSVSKQSRYRVYRRIAEEFVCPRAVAGPTDLKLNSSMLLYGPPGTGKSTIADELAKSLGYRKVTITPSDFISGGEASVEARAKGIFLALEEQDSLVVLFDEIDQFLLDRESKRYEDQKDLFKLLTPGMLTKLNDLSKQRRNVYVVATNYIERIDRAIKRPGRIHARYLVLPPCRTQRMAHLRRQLPAWDGSSPDKGLVADRTVLCTYQELNDLADAVNRQTQQQAGALPVALDHLSDEMRAALSLESYRERVKKPDLAVGAPLEEFAMVAYLLLESKDIAKEDWIRDGIVEALAMVKDEDVVKRLEEWKATR